MRKSKRKNGTALQHGEALLTVLALSLLLNLALPQGAIGTHDTVQAAGPYMVADTDRQQYAFRTMHWSR